MHFHALKDVRPNGLRTELRIERTEWSPGWVIAFLGKARHS